jgi:hypothetical protein
MEKHMQNIMKMKSAEMKDVAPIHAGKDIQEDVDISEKMKGVSLGRDVHMCIVRLSRRLRLIP